MGSLRVLGLPPTVQRRAANGVRLIVKSGCLCGLHRQMSWGWKEADLSRVYLASPPLPLSMHGWMDRFEYFNSL